MCVIEPGWQECCGLSGLFDDEQLAAFIATIDDDKVHYIVRQTDEKSVKTFSVASQPFLSFPQVE